MTTVEQLTNALQNLAPLQYAAEWDNVGLLLGDPQWPADRIGLTIDLTDDIINELIEQEVQAIVAYHPPIFKPIKRITTAAEKQRIILKAAQRNIAIYSPHTALDAAPGGVNDWLASAFGDAEGSPLHQDESLPATEQRKIVTFTPADAADAIRIEMSRSGAGCIGDYSQCSFEIPGTGTFFAGDTTNPAVGSKNQLEQVNEVRLEMVCSAASLGAAIAALRKAHPYETPPIEIYRLHPRPSIHIGQGRIVRVHEPLSLENIVDRLKVHLDVEQLKIAAGKDSPSKYQTIGLCPGAGGSLVEVAIRQGCELFLTGEMRHHDVLAAQAAKCTIILAGHTNTERGYLNVLAGRISEALPSVTSVISDVDIDPFTRL